MGFEYALVHLKYTIPPAIAFTLIYRPLCTRLDVYKILFLISIAVVATIPWDSYLIRRKVWTYPSSVIIGPRIFSIPAEELFFFVIQTYNTSLIYLLCSKPTFKPSYLVGTRSGDGCGELSLLRLRRYRVLGQVVILFVILSGVTLIKRAGEGTYLGLVLAWAGPFAFLLWTLAYQFLINLPSTNTALPIILPTVYLWIVDTLALRRGTWTIESGTKLGVHVWDGLEIEEAVFFLVTNILIVFGLVAFENAVAVLETFPFLFPDLPTLPSPVLLVQALFTNPTRYDNDRIKGIQEAVGRLKRKSRSFYLASSVFSGRLRIDLILLYSFCRVADDLIDDAPSESAARLWITRLSEFLDSSYVPFANSVLEGREKYQSLELTTVQEFQESSRAALLLLPTTLLSSKPLYDLLAGFKTDLDFSSSTFPIRGEKDLELYASQVAGTVAELCLELLFYHSPDRKAISQSQREYLILSGGRMGVALQFVNIARDIAVDAAINRVYIPTSWLREEGLHPEDVVANPDGEKIKRLRSRLLEKAFVIYREAKNALLQLPRDSRAPMRVAVESYMEIGRVLQEQTYRVKAGRATVPKLRRMKVAWKVLNEG